MPKFPFGVQSTAPRFVKALKSNPVGEVPDIFSHAMANGVRLLTVFAVTLLAAGCESVRTISPSEDNSAEVTYEQGVAVLTSKKKNTVVLRFLEPTLHSSGKQLPAMYVGFLNKTRKTVDFSTANIRVVSGGNKLHVYTYGELAHIIETRAATARFIVALGAGLQSVAASMPNRNYTSGTFNANANLYGSNGEYAYGSANGSFSGSTTSYDPAASAAAIAIIQRNAMEEAGLIEQARNSAMRGIATVLRRNTVTPGKAVGGLVSFDPRNVKPEGSLLVVVTIRDETHGFIFDVSK